jgi:hypothetical protein
MRAVGEQAGPVAEMKMHKDLQSHGAGVGPRRHWWVTHPTSRCAAWSGPSPRRSLRNQARSASSPTVGTLIGDYSANALFRGVRGSLDGIFWLGRGVTSGGREHGARGEGGGGRRHGREKEDAREHFVRWSRERTEKYSCNCLVPSKKRVIKR